MVFLSIWDTLLIKTSSAPGEWCMPVSVWGQKTRSRFIFVHIQHPAPCIVYERWQYTLLLGNDVKFVQPPWLCLLTVLWLRGVPTSHVSTIAAARDERKLPFLSPDFFLTYRLNLSKALLTTKSLIFGYFIFWVTRHEPPSSRSNASAIFISSWFSPHCVVYSLCLLRKVEMERPVHQTFGSNIWGFIFSSLSLSKRASSPVAPHVQAHSQKSFVS